jgi:membrane protein DedA with SNARE-associated domain
MEQLLALLSEYGLWIVFFGMILEGTTVIIISGVLCHMGVLPCEKTIIVAILGAVAGDQTWFYIGRHYADRVLSKFPKLQTQVQKLQNKVQTKGNMLAVSSRFIYGGAVIFPLVLAINKYPHTKFTLLDTLGVSLASLAGLALGYFLSDSFQKVLGEINYFEHMLLLIIVAAVTIKLYYNYKK